MAILFFFLRFRFSSGFFFARACRIDSVFGNSPCVSEFKAPSTRPSIQRRCTCRIDISHRSAITFACTYPIILNFHYEKHNVIIPIIVVHSSYCKNYFVNIYKTNKKTGGLSVNLITPSHHPLIHIKNFITQDLNILFIVACQQNCLFLLFQSHKQFTHL